MARRTRRVAVSSGTTGGGRTAAAGRPPLTTRYSPAPEKDYANPATHRTLPLVRSSGGGSGSILHRYLSELESRAHLPLQRGTVMTVEFELDGQKLTAINGGPIFKFREAT